MKVTSLDQLAMHSRFVQLKHPFTDEPLTGPDGKPLGFQVAPIKSNIMRSASLAIQREQASLTPEDLKDPEKLLLFDLRLYASAVVGWSHDAIFGEYSPERALEIVTNANQPQLAVQIQSALIKEQDFFGV